MRIELSDEAVEVRLSWWQKALGLLGNIRVARSAVSDVHVVDEPIPEAMKAGVKVGLRLPWFCFIARTIHLDTAFIVRRGVPAVSFAVNDGGKLERVLVSTKEAEQLARRLQGG